MGKVDPTARVRIWDTYLKLTRSHAQTLFTINQPAKTVRTSFSPAGGTLSAEQLEVLATLTLCTLAIEARANHLIAELVEANQISESMGQAAERLPPDEKWFLLPVLARRRRRLNANSGPHQAIRQIVHYRNRLVHVKYGQLEGNLPPGSEVLKLFERFVEAMEDMNVVLRRIRAPRRAVLAIGRFA
jgi:hypothetical protein